MKFRKGHLVAVLLRHATGKRNAERGRSGTLGLLHGPQTNRALQAAFSWAWSKKLVRGPTPQETFHGHPNQRDRAAYLTPKGWAALRTMKTQARLAKRKRSGSR